MRDKKEQLCQPARAYKHAWVPADPRQATCNADCEQGTFKIPQAVCQNERDGADVTLQAHDMAGVFVWKNHVLDVGLHMVQIRKRARQYACQGRNTHARVLGHCMQTPLR